MKNRKKYSLNSNVIVIWMTSFVLLLLFSVSIFLLSYISVEKRLNKQMKQMNEAFMEERIGYIDNYINNIMNGLFNITKLDGFEDMLWFDTKNETEKKYAISKFSQKMKSLEIVDLELASYFVYIPDEDLIIGNGVIRNSQEYFEISNLNGSYENWKKDVLDENAKNMICYDSDNGLVYFKAWNSVVGNRHIMTSIVIPKADFIKNFKATSEMDFVISGINNSQILSITDKDYSDLIKNLDFKSWISTKFFDNQIISYQKGISADWNYLCVYDTRVYTGVFKTTRIIALCFGAAIMLLGILMGYYFTRKNNKFIFKLVDILNVRKYPNEYEAVYEAVNKIIADANKNSDILYTQNKNIRNELLEKLLLNKVLPTGIDAQMNQTRLIFEHEYFCVAEIGMERYFNIFFEDNPNKEEALSLSKYIIDNVYGDLHNKDIKIYPVDVGGTKIVLVINCTYKNEEDKFNIKQTLNFGAAFIEENFNISLTIALSEIMKGKSNIHKCYESVLWAKDYIMCDYNDILDCGEIKESKTYIYYSYSQNDEQLLIADIKRGDRDKVANDISKIFKRNIAKKTAPKFMKILAINIFDLIIRMVNIEKVNADNFSETVNETYKMIENFESVRAVEESLCTFAGTVCCLINTDEQQYKRSVIEEIKKYIDKNYTDQALNVNYIANYFNLKPSFLSTLFKTQEEVGVLEYITMKRINAAKHLLKTTDYTMSVVWEKVGFTSERTFFRTFEKYVGTSPGKFKREL